MSRDKKRLPSGPHDFILVEQYDIPATDTGGLCHTPDYAVEYAEWLSNEYREVDAAREVNGTAGSIVCGFILDPNETLTVDAKAYRRGRGGVEVDLLRLIDQYGDYHYAGYPVGY